eukprot:CAMPEP_0119409446 /NCGR_PEP_ID=MMETSP1335-20130426/2730_1 /TAXON_ID=259385 /ORGANISM="Chrysoculter rhomboideus, Strain RCC1486" /LENGTH=114 /DNA_ID=CAMNT_0007433823 /DNA_START=260 /DNA_END=601 /DNA_ORIENTATION=+
MLIRDGRSTVRAASVSANRSGSMAQHSLTSPCGSTHGLARPDVLERYEYETDMPLSVLMVGSSFVCVPDEHVSLLVEADECSRDRASVAQSHAHGPVEIRGNLRAELIGDAHCR